MTITIRRASPGDLAALLALVEEYCSADGHRFEIATATAGLRPLLDNDEHGIVWVATVDGSIEGYAAVTWGWSIEIGGLDVVLDEIYARSRGRGIGSQLLQALEIECRARGVKRIFLETELANDAARRLYERNGYDADTSIWMAKELS